MSGFNDREDGMEIVANSVISRMSDLGGKSNPLGNTAATLFYQGAKNSLESTKYAKYLFYGIGQHTRGSGIQDSVNMNDHANSAYYLSENRTYNKNISSKKSKNPTARNLVNFSSSVGDTDDNFNAIIGGSSAPYNWSDFLYCKHYGRIPNNYMITLRRYPTPMLDNLSLPNAVRETELHKIQGAGKPVAQAVTWFGGDTGNDINDIISFTTGLKWHQADVKHILRQKGFDQGFQKSILGMLATMGEEIVTGSNTISEALVAISGIASGATKEGEAKISDARINYSMRERGVENDGPLSDHIFTSVDVIDETYYRGAGLTWDNSEIVLDFHYELTSVGQVNTKAAFLDIFANLLSIGTNYGTFLRPDFRYDNSFPAIGFPGGDQGLFNFYAAPFTFVTEYLTNVTENPEANAANLSNIKQGDSNIASGNSHYIDFSGISKEFEGKDITDPEVRAAMDRAAKTLLAGNFLENLHLNVSYFNGAPIGEWHLVVGNPLNPIAMIGNLICETLSFEFGEKLGPDDFPTELTATFTLQHGRGRERGEIESMFNRGMGRLYQSALTVSSNAMSENKTDSDGNNLGSKAQEKMQEKMGTQRGNK